MTIQWLGHACFSVAYQGYTIVLDPYRDGTVPGLHPLDVSANAVLCSHQHDDHGYAQAVRLLDTDKPSPFEITCIESWHDDAQGKKRGPNTIHVLVAGGLRVCHLGDLGHLPDDDAIRAIGTPDALMIPIGGHYTIDAVQAKAVTDLLGPRVILPMHYRSDRFGFPVIGTLEPFVSLYTEVEYSDSNTLPLGSSQRPRVCVLSYV